MNNTKNIYELSWRLVNEAIPEFDVTLIRELLEQGADAGLKVEAGTSESGDPIMVNAVEAYMENIKMLDPWSPVAALPVADSLKSRIVETKQRAADNHDEISGLFMEFATGALIEYYLNRTEKGTLASSIRKALASSIAEWAKDEGIDDPYNDAIDHEIMLLALPDEQMMERLLALHEKGYPLSRTAVQILRLGMLNTAQAKRIS